MPLAKKFSSNWKCASNIEEYINYAIEAYNNKDKLTNYNIDIINKMNLLDKKKYQNFFNIINS